MLKKHNIVQLLYQNQTLVRNRMQKASLNKFLEIL